MSTHRARLVLDARHQSVNSALEMCPLLPAPGRVTAVTAVTAVTEQRHGDHGDHENRVTAVTAVTNIASRRSWW